MGNYNSSPELTEELSRFKTHVLFTDHEIVKLYRRFQKLGGDLNTPITMEKFLSIPEIRFNPFRFRFARVFGDFESDLGDDSDAIAKLANSPRGAVSPKNKLTREQLLKASQDLEGMVMTFDGFLKMLSTCSYRSDLNSKSRLAFSLYDFDQDGDISTLDIECMLTIAMGESQLHPAQYSQIAQEVMSEVDIDGNGTLTELEFGRVLVRLQDFESRMTLEVEF